MTRPIRRVAVLGAGVMGSGIAAHCANAGIPVLLLDIVPPKLSDADKQNKAARDGFAAGALARLKKARPAAFFQAGRARLIEVGNFDDDLDKVADCDLIVEAVIEKLEIKRDLFTRLEKICADTDTIIASNTSGLRIADMVVGRSEKFKQHFLVTHFFNPPRYMKLLELVAGPDTAPAVVERIEHWGKEALGKGIVWAKDTPNFVANRIGAHSMMAVIHLMLEMGLAPEDVDAITGLPMGHPKSATFRTGDMVGLDTLGHVVENCHEVLVEDEDREVFATPPFLAKMIEQGRLGNKTKGGFYKKVGKDIQTLDPTTGEYRPKGGNAELIQAAKKIGKLTDPRKRVRKLVATEGVIGEFAWKALSKSLAYSARRVGEITDSVKAIDDGMKWGYNWELGPFEIWDALGFAETCDRMAKDGIALPASIDKMREAGAPGFYSDGKAWNLGRGDWDPIAVRPARGHPRRPAQGRRPGAPERRRRGVGSR